MPHDLTGWVKAQALALGFGAVGIAPVEDPRHGQAFAEWLAAGHHGEMAYLARTAEKRLSLRQSLPWARSVVAVALPYHAPYGRSGAAEGGRGRISRHAWGDDYRDIVRGKLLILLGAIRREAGSEVQGQVHTDGGPVMEREIAARAGIGWVGKNTLLLSAHLGSFFVLGELFLDLPLECDDPVAERCGSCRACLDVCPTQAFVRPYVLDARRCISYLTIELKGAVPRELRPLMGDHLFGCDLCQDVCPYNGRRRFAEEQRLRPREGLYRPELAPLLAMPESGFRERFRGSAILRSKRRGFLRNVCVALGNLGEPEAVPVLARALTEDGEPQVRAHAAWALGAMNSEKAKSTLRGALDREGDPAVREEIRFAMLG